MSILNRTLEDHKQDPRFKSLSYEGQMRFVSDYSSNWDSEYGEENANREAVLQNLESVKSDIDLSFPNPLKGEEGYAQKQKEWEIGREASELVKVANQELPNEPTGSGRGASGRSRVRQQREDILKAREDLASLQIRNDDVLSQTGKDVSTLAEDYSRASWSSNQTGGTSITKDSDGMIHYDPNALFSDDKGVDSLLKDVDGMDALITSKREVKARILKDYDERVTGTIQLLEEYGTDEKFSDSAVAKSWKKKISESKEKTLEGKKEEAAIRMIKDSDGALSSLSMGAFDGLYSIGQIPQNAIKFIRGGEGGDPVFSKEREIINALVNSQDRSRLEKGLGMAGKLAVEVPLSGGGAAVGRSVGVNLLKSGGSKVINASQIAGASIAGGTTAANNRVSELDGENKRREDSGLAPISGDEFRLKTANSFAATAVVTAIAPKGLDFGKSSWTATNKAIKGRIANGVRQAGTEQIEERAEGAIVSLADHLTDVAIKKEDENGEVITLDKDLFNKALEGADMEIEEAIVTSIFGGVAGVGEVSKINTADKAFKKLKELTEAQVINSEEGSTITDESVKALADRAGISERDARDELNALYDLGDKFFNRESQQSETVNPNEITNPIEAVSNIARGEEIRDADIVGGLTLDKVEEIGASVGDLNEDLEVQNVTEAKQELDLSTDAEGVPLAGQEQRVKALNKYINEQEQPSGDANQERDGGDNSPNRESETNTEENSPETATGEGSITEGSEQDISPALAGEVRNNTDVSETGSGSNTDTVTDDIQQRDATTTEPVGEAVATSPEATQEQVDITNPEAESEIQDAPDGVDPSGEVTPKKRRRLKAIPRDFFEPVRVADDPLISFVSDFGGIESKTTSKKKGKKNASEFDDVVKFSPTTNRLVYGGSENVDTVAQAAFEAGLINEPSSGALFDGIARAENSVKNTNRDGASRAKEQAKQVNMDRDFDKSKAKADKGDTKLMAYELEEGQTLIVDGEKIEVAEIEYGNDGIEETIILQDGARFGRQEVDPNEVIYVEEIKDASSDTAPKFGEGNVAQKSQDSASLFDDQGGEDLALVGGETQATEFVEPDTRTQQEIDADNGQGDLLGGEVDSTDVNQDAGSTPAASTKKASDVKIGDTIQVDKGGKQTTNEIVKEITKNEDGSVTVKFTSPTELRLSPDRDVSGVISAVSLADNKISNSNNSQGIVASSMAEILTIEPVQDSNKTRLQRGIAPDPNTASNLQKKIYFFESVLFKNGETPISTRRQLADLETKRDSYNTMFTKLGEDLQLSIDSSAKDSATKQFYEELAYRALKGDNDSLNSLPEKVKASVISGRSSIDELSSRLLKDSIVTKELANKVGSNIGQYVLREFKVFDPDSGWNYDNIKSEHPDIYNEALKYIMGSKEMNSVDADEVIQAMTDASRAQSFYMGESKVGKIDVTSFMKRKDLPMPILNLLGEIRDPAINIARTGSKVAGIVATHDTQKKVAQILLQQGFASRVKNGRINKRVGGEEITFPTIDEKGKPAVGRMTQTSKSMSGFGEIYMTPELAEAFESHFSPPNKDLKLWDMVGSGLAKINSFSKFNQVILNPAAYPTNAIGAFMVNLLNGYVSLNSFKAYGKSSRFSKSERAYNAKDQVSFYGVKVEDFRSNGGSTSMSPKQFEIETEAYGLRDNNVAANDLLETVNDGWKFKPEIIKKMSKAYQAPDNASKRAAFAHEIDKWSNALPDGATMDEVMRLAAKDVKRVTQNYDMIPLFVKELSQRGLGVATYISFTYELVRNTAETVRLTKEELMSDNPVIRKSGAMRLAGMAAIGSMLYGLNELVGGDDEERDAIKRSLAPPWLKGKGILYFGKDSQGRYRYADPSYIIPHQAFYNAINSVVSADSPDEAFGAFTDALKDNFGQLNIMMQTSAEMIANKKVEGGQIYNPEIEGEKEKQLTNHLFKSMFKPGVWKTIEKIQDAKKGKTKSYGSTATWDDLAWNIIGVRPYTVDPKSETFLSGHMSSFIYRHRDVSSFDSASKQAKRTLGEQAEAIEKVDASVEEIKQEAKNFYEDAMKMGVTKAEILKAEKDIKMPKAYRYNALIKSK